MGVVCLIVLSGCTQASNFWDELWEDDPSSVQTAYVPNSYAPVGTSRGFNQPITIPLSTIPGTPPQQAPLSPSPVPRSTPAVQPTPYTTASALHLGQFVDQQTASNYAAAFWGRQPAVLQGISAHIAPQRTDGADTVYNLFGVTDSWSRAQLACNQFQARGIYCGVVTLPIGLQYRRGPAG